MQSCGRVGRVRPGVCVQISVKGNEFKEELESEIKTTDITSNILSLMKIGINLEDIDNIPDELDKNDLQLFMSDLFRFGAIDENTRT